MTALSLTPFAQAVRTGGGARLPREFRTVEEARRFVERERLPIRRSGFRWLDVHNRLTLAQATRRAADVAAARAALARALEQDARERPGLAA